MRRSRTQSDITSALSSPPVDDLTRPELHVPVDVPPDDLTEAHSVYEGSDEDSVSLANEAPFGAHRQPDAVDLRVDPWPSSPSRGPSPSKPPPSRPSSPPGSVTRVRTRTIAVEEDPTSGWAAPEPQTFRAPASTPPSVIVATASTPPSVMVSPSLAPSPPEPWTQPMPSQWPAQLPMQQGPMMGAAPPPRSAYGTVEMNLRVMHGVPTPLPAPALAPQSVAPAPTPAKGVSALVWVLVVLALLACAAMMVYGRVRAG